MAVRFQDYYQTLGVSRTASQDEIRRAFRKLARQYHPDVNKSRDAEDKFRAVNEAYEVLGDPEKRKKYDQLGANWKSGQEFRAPPGWENLRYEYRGRPSAGASAGRGGFSFSPGGFSDFFEMFFGRASGGGRGGAFSSAGGGVDIEDLFRQAHEEQSRGEAGFGGAAAAEPTQAEIEVTVEELAAGGVRQLHLQTPDGQTRTLRVKIPAGVQPGSKIRLKGQGGGGRDLLLIVRVAPHPRYELSSGDLIVDLPVAPWEAALGGKATVSTLHGEVTVTIPAGAQTGQKLRLRGRGLPNAKGKPGDLLARIRIVNPPKLSDAEKRLFEQLKNESKFDPRR